jgi:hypothetical protein
VTAPSVIRRAKGNPSYRLVNEDELVAGLEVFMVDIDIKYVVENPYSKITLDENPIRKRAEGNSFVYYHCTSAPKWVGQCFVPVSKFTTSVDDHQQYVGGGPRYEYWLPLRG